MHRRAQGQEAAEASREASARAIRAERQDQGLTRDTRAPGRGKELADHVQVATDIGVEFYFALPHHLWQRGTNENANGLLREHFPKGESLGRVSKKAVQGVYDKLNRRPRKRLGYRTPYEVRYSKTLHLI